MAQPAKVIEILTMLAEVYDKQPTAPQIKAYQLALSDITDEALMAGAEDYLKVGKWFPKIPELREAAKPYEGKSTIDFLMAEYVECEFDCEALLDMAGRFETAGREYMTTHCRERAMRPSQTDADRARYIEWGKL